MNEIKKCLYEKWAYYYKLSRAAPTSINCNGKNIIIMGELWSSDCIYEYLENTGGVDGILFGDFENYLWDAINYVMEIEEWDDYVYIDNYESGEEMGITIFIKY